MSSLIQAAKGAAQAAVKKAIELSPDSWMPGGTPDPLMREKHGLIGAPVSRIDGPQKVRGNARFAAEVPAENLAFAALRYATIPRGRIAALDLAAAEAAPGVVLVMTHRNAPRMKPMPLFGSSQTANGGNDLPVLQDDRVHWNGQPIALVLADTQEQADHAASLIGATFEAEPALTDFAEAVAKGTEPAQFMGQPLRTAVGDAEATLRAAPRKVDARYSTPRHSHNPIEPHAATLYWTGDELRVHDATQAVSHTAASLAHVFGIDAAQVHVTSPFVGGGFGAKTLWEHQILGAAAAKLSGRPVRIALCARASTGSWAGAR